MRFLKLWLPDGSARLWTVFVNGQATEPARDGDAYRIPLEKEASDETTVLEFVYAQTVSKSFTGTQRYVGPRFSLPLNNITWTFYVVPTKKYYAFGGSMNLAEDVEVVAFDWDRYTQNNLRQMHAAATKAKWGLRKGHEYEETGDPNRAKKAYAEAMNLAQTQADREDARIQYENVAKQQAIVGLVQRRNKMRMQQNISGALQEEQLAGYNEGNFTIDYARSIQQSLDSDENAALGQLTQRIIAQQAAAAGVAQAIRIQMPEDGKKLEFVREIHINPESALTVEFKAVDLTGLGRSWNVLWIGLVALIVFRLTAAKLVAVKKGK
jgi:hypothetical protein